MKIGQVLIGVCAIAAVGLALVTRVNNRLLLQQVDAQRQLIEQKSALVDSLHDELFVLQTQFGRVELTLEHLNEVDPDAFLEFSRYYDHETE